jgi:hypothetical protein
MAHQFSHELTQRAQTYFGEKSGRDISHEEANEYMNSLASLYESFMELAVAGGTASDALARSSPPAVL